MMLTDSMNDMHVNQADCKHLSGLLWNINRITFLRNLSPQSPTNVILFTPLLTYFIAVVSNKL